MPRKKNTQQTINICPCGVEAQVDTFTWANLGGDLVLLCWDCTDKLHRDTIEKDRTGEVSADK